MAEEANNSEASFAFESEFVKNTNSTYPKFYENSYTYSNKSAVAMENDIEFPFMGGTEKGKIKNIFTVRDTPVVSVEGAGGQMYLGPLSMVVKKGGRRRQPRSRKNRSFRKQKQRRQRTRRQRN